MCRDLRRAFRLYSSPLSLQQDGKIKKGILISAADGEVCVARIGDFVFRVDHLQGAHELDRRENRAQTLRIIVMIRARQPLIGRETGNLPSRILFSTLDSDPH